MFARLAPGATLESAQSELDVAGQRAAAELPVVYASLRPRVAEFARGGTTAQLTLLLSAVRLLFALLAAIICANVATLVFARTVMREGEIALRTSLGASRWRVVLQLVGETLVLVVGAALLGLTIASLTLPSISRLFFTIQQVPRPPFWWNDALSMSTIVYAVVLAAVGALMIGVVPALRATKGELQPRLSQLSAGGGGGLRLGGVWTVVIVLQVAFAVALLPIAVAQGGTVFANPVRTSFPADEYVTAQLGRDPPVPARTEEERAELFETSWRLFQETRDRIAADLAVQGVALASGLSGLNHIQVPVEADGGASGPTLSSSTRILLVDPSYLDLMSATVVAGRALGPADFTPQSLSVVVNEAFVENAFGGRNAVGSRIRFSDRIEEQAIVAVPATGTSVEIVGVVEDPEVDVFGPGAHPVIYAPLELAPVSPRDVGFVGMPQPPVAQLFVRLRPNAEPLAGRLYGIVAAVDPTLRLSQVATAEGAWGPAHQGGRLAAWIVMAVSAIVLTLSVAGIYALMSFAVTRRTREIAIRAAVGAGRGQIIRAVFQRALVQLMVGLGLGGFVAVPVLWGGLEDSGPRTLAVVAVVLLAAGLGACLLPVRRALAIEPSLAMKSE
jgi:putative ABC transport system permease protein